MRFNQLAKSLFVFTLLFFSFIASSAQPDLIVDSISYYPTMKQYQQLAAGITIKNIGTSAVDKFNVTNIYFSKDSIYSEDDKYAGFISFSVLAVGDTIEKSIIGGANQFGVNAGAEYKYVIARADYRGEVTEIDETNNFAFSPITIEDAQVDLAVKSAVKNGPNPVRQGDNLDITLNLINLGSDPIHNTFYEYFISSDLTLDAADIRIGYLNYASFYWKLETTESDNPAVPGTLEPGIYYVLVRINTDGQELDIVDYDMSNNIKDLFQIDVKPALVNNTLSFDQEFGTKTWTEDNHVWSWNDGWDNIRNYGPKAGSGHAMAVAGNGAKLSTTSSIDIKGLWIEVDIATNYSSLELKGYDHSGNQSHSITLNPIEYIQYTYVTLNWENVNSFQVNHEVTSHSGGGVFYDEIDYTYRIDQTGPILECPGFWIPNCGSSMLPDYSYLLSPKNDCGEIQFSQIPAPGTVFTSDQIFVRISAIDECNNSSSCSFWVSNGGSSTVEEIACFSYTSPSGKIWDSSGIYLDTLQNYVGCDSIITVNLTIKAVDTLVTFNKTELVANADDADYQWLKCTEGGGYSSLVDEVNKTYTLTEAGMYAVEVSQDGCTAVSNCHTIIVVGTDEELDENLVSFPNPTTNELTVKLGKTYDDVSIVLRNNAGKEIENQFIGTTNRVELSMKAFPSGLYFLSILSKEQKISVVKVMKD